MSSESTLIDSHCHLDFECFNLTLENLLYRCRQKNISHFIVPAVKTDSWSRLLLLAERHKNWFVALGLHPYFIHQHEEKHLIHLNQQLAQPRFSRIVAIGEIGLDFSLTEASWPKQIAYFQEQLQMAKDHKLPIILHHRQSIDVLCKYIKATNFEYGGVLHAFSGSLQQAQRMIDLGFKLGVGGTITYPRAQKTRKVIQQLPLESLVLETDSPDMPINGQQGQQNTPLSLLAILTVLTEIRRESPQVIKQALWDNTQAIFKLNLSCNQS